MDRQHFSNSRVMIEDERSGISGGVEVAHTGLRPTDEAAIAEDHPGLLRTSDEAIPEQLVYGGNGLLRRSLSASTNG